MKPHWFLTFFSFKETQRKFSLRKDIPSSNGLFLISVFADTMLESDNHPFT